MKLFNIFAGIMGFIGLVFIVSLFFPHTYKIEKSTLVNKPVSQTFNYLNQIESWSDWSPWNTKVDSSMVFFYSKNKSGIGAAQYFRGGLVGNGSFRIIQSIPNEKLTYRLSINEGTMAIKQTFEFKPLGNGTQLTWIDEGDVGMNPIYRFLLPSKISATEQGFEEGLMVIKKAAERAEY